MCWHIMLMHNDAVTCRSTAARLSSYQTGYLFRLTMRTSMPLHSYRCDFLKRSGRSMMVKPNGPLQPAETYVLIPDMTPLRGLARAFY